MADVILVLIILAIVGSSVAYIIKEKKRGVRCVGCSSGGSCGGKCTGKEENDSGVSSNKQ